MQIIRLVIINNSCIVSDNTTLLWITYSIIARFPFIRFELNIHPTLSLMLCFSVSTSNRFIFIAFFVHNLYNLLCNREKNVRSEPKRKLRETAHHDENGGDKIATCDVRLQHLRPALVKRFRAFVATRMGVRGVATIAGVTISQSCDDW